MLFRANTGHGTLCQLRLKVLDGVCCMLHPAGGQEEHGREKYAAAGIPEQWVPVLHKMGFLTVEALKKLAPGKLHNDLCGYNKKNKLELQNPTLDEVKGWTAG